MNCLILADIYNLKAEFKLLGKSREYEKERMSELVRERFWHQTVNSILTKTLLLM